MTQKIIITLLAMSIILPVIFFNADQKNFVRFKKTLTANIIFFFGVLLFSTLFIFTSPIIAEPEVKTIADPTAQAIGYLAAGLVTGLSTIGAGIATGSAAAAAVGAVSENEKIMGKALLFVALAEGIAIYGLLISFTILGRI